MILISPTKLIFKFLRDFNFKCHGNARFTTIKALKLSLIKYELNINVYNFKKFCSFLTLQKCKNYPNSIILKLKKYRFHCKSDIVMELASELGNFELLHKIL